MRNVGKSVSERFLDGCLHNELPQSPHYPLPPVEPTLFAPEPADERISSDKKVPPAPVLTAIWEHSMMLFDLLV